MSLRGSVDSLDVEGASGWIFDTDGGRTVVVQAMLDGRVIGEAPAELPRPDLAAAGCRATCKTHPATTSGTQPPLASRGETGCLTR